MGRIKYDELPADQKANLKALHAALFDLETAYLKAGGKPFKVSSGYRSPAQNAAANGAKKSAHMVCKACDFADPDGAIDAWLSLDPQQDLLEKLNLWQEQPTATKNWSHIDTNNRPTIKRPNCRKRQFNP
jgi:hypothetical protein